MNVHTNGNITTTGRPYNVKGQTLANSFRNWATSSLAIQIKNSFKENKKTDNKATQNTEAKMDS